MGLSESASASCSLREPAELPASRVGRFAREAYENVYYTHQGWLLEDHSHLVMDDEIEELSGPTQNTRTLVW